MTILSNLPHPHDLELPFPEWRAVQIEVIEKCLASDKRFIIIDAPTGVGKSGIAIALHHLMDVSRTVVTTSTKLLQQQYNQVFDIPTIWGRSNYNCNIIPELNASEGPCQIDKGCSNTEKWVRCPYYRAKKVAANAPIAILNTSYFLHEANYVGMFSKLDLLVLDEGHLLDSALMGFVGVELTFKSLMAYTSRWKEKLDKPSQLLDLVREIHPKVQQEFLEAADRAMSTNSNESIRALGKIQRLNERLLRVKELDFKDWVLCQDMLSFRLVPIVVSNITESYVFRHAERILVMSATINKEVFARQMGINTDEMTFISAKSPFLPAMRPVLFSPVVKLNWKSEEKDYDILCGAINRIMDDKTGQNGIIHCVSYKLRDRIMEGLSTGNRRRIVTHGRGYEMTREEAIDALKNSSNGTTLLSPSSEVGLDLPDDEARWGIWAKIPFPDMKDKQVEARKKIDSEWFLWNAVASIIQGTGRIVRHAGDWGVFYILDKNLAWILKRHENLFPQWFLDAVRYRKPSQLVGKAKEYKEHSTENHNVTERSVVANRSLF